MGELEFEGEDPAKAKVEMERALGILEIPQAHADFRPISVIFAEKQGLL